MYVSELPQDSKNFFTISKKNTIQFFNETRRISPKYHQSIVNLQQDYIDAWKTVINSAISLEQEYATNTGFLTKVSETTLQTIRDMVKMSNQAYIQQNKLTFDTVKTTKDAFNIFNETTKSFALLNEEIMRYLMSIYDQKLKT
jgi:hypothetical protein